MYGHRVSESRKCRVPEHLNRENGVQTYFERSDTTHSKSNGSHRRSNAPHGRSSQGVLCHRSSRNGSSLDAQTLESIRSMCPSTRSRNSDAREGLGVQIRAVFRDERGHTTPLTERHMQGFGRERRIDHLLRRWKTEGTLRGKWTVHLPLPSSCQQAGGGWGAQVEIAAEL